MLFTSFFRDNILCLFATYLKKCVIFIKKFFLKRNIFITSYIYVFFTDGLTKGGKNDI